ncbi:hypothetical protein ACJMK2_018518 [Sinanodonta woodiana]|uniref:RING-type domain-containing protein n=1 Tax=Sinanodonta woodiana TaxID=1069815 RepID=A0ABD3UH10_SINWO
MQTVQKMESKFTEFFLTLNHRDIPYIAEVALRMPVLALIHLWMLFSPDSDYWILSLPCFMIRYGVSLLLLGQLSSTRSRLLFFYVFSMPLLFFGPVVNSLQESVAKFASEESTFQFSRLALATIAMILFIIFFQKLYIPPKFSTIMWLSTFIILILICLVWLFSLNIFVSLVYWITKLLFTAIFIWILFVNCELNAEVGQIADTMKRCHARDMLVLFGLSYYTYAITCEIKCGMPLLDLVSYQGLNYIISIWCTSVIVLDSIVSIFMVIGNIVIIIIIYCLVAEEVDRERLRPLIYIGKANNIWAPFHIFAMQIGVLRVDGETKPDVVSALLHFTLVILLTKIWFTLEPFLTQLGANAAERKLRVHIGVVTINIIIVICSLLLSLNIADWLQIGLWPIINCFGWLLLVTTSTMTLMCYMVNMFSWYYDMDITKTQDIIYYISLSKSISIVVCSFLEGYHRLFFPFFPQNLLGLIVHGILITLGQVIIVFTILSLEYAIHMQRTKSRAVVQSLPQATPDQVAHLDDVCAICMGEIGEGLVTPCNHIFHSECIRRACTIRPSCPMCNQPLC